MPTVIDALMVTLGLDPSGYKKGTAEADKAGKQLAADQAATAKKVAGGFKKAGDEQIVQTKKVQDAQRKASTERHAQDKQAQEQAKKVAERYRAVSTEVANVTAALVGASSIKSFVSSTFGGLESLGRLSKNLGVDPRTIDAYHNSIKKLGGDAQDFDQFAARIATVSSKLKQHMALSGDENEFYNALMGRYHVSQADIQNNNVAAVIDQVTRTVDGLSNQGKAVNLSTYLGLTPGMILLMQEGTVGLKKLYQEQYNASQATRENTRTATEAEQTWRDMKNTFGQVGSTLTTMLAPAIKEVNKLLGDFNTLMKAHPTETTIGTVAGAAGLWLGGKMLLGKLLGKVFKGKGARGGLGDALGGALGEAGGALPVYVVNMPGMEGPSLPGRGPKSGGAGAGGAAAGAGRSWIARTFPWLARIGVGAGLMLYSSGLNKGEQAELERRRKGIVPPSGSPATAATSSWDAAIDGLEKSAFGALIAKGEGDYNAVNRGLRYNYAAGDENLEGMTVAEVMAAQREGRFNAAGRYQIIKGTLADAAKTMGLSGNERFDRAMQDRIFSQYLVGHKRRALGDFLSGKSNDLMAAVYAAAKEWASVAVPQGMKTESGRISDGTVTYYDKSGKNRASTTAQQMASAILNSRSGGALPSLSPMLAAGSQARYGSGGMVNSNNKTDTHIGTVNVYGSNTSDGQAVVADMRGELSKNGLIVSSAIPMA